MVAPAVIAACNSGLDIWVAILCPYVTSFIQKIEQGLINVLGSLPAILAHSDECGPVPRAKSNKKNERPQLELAVWPNKTIEIGHAVVQAVAYPLDAIERNFTHRSHAGHGSCLHIPQRGVVSAGQAPLLGFVGNAGAGNQPQIPGARIA